MIYGQFLTITGIVFSSILLIVYYSKNYFKTMQSTIYRYMVISNICFATMQFLYVLGNYYNINEMVVFVGYKLSWIFSMLCYAFYFWYCIAYVNDDKSKSMKEFFKKYKSCTGVLIALIASIFIYVVFISYFPLEKVNMPYIHGSKSYFTIFYCFSMSVAIVIALIVNRAKMSKKDLIILSVFFVVGFTGTVLQAIYNCISILPFFVVIVMYSLYFTTEDPDLAILKNTMKVREEVEKSNQVKLDFISNVSYEIKNPMDSITSLTETLLNVPFSPNTAKSYLKQICDSGSDLLDITNNILDMSVIETGNNLIKNKNYNVAEMIVRLVEIIKNKLGYSKIHFNVSIDTDMPSVLYGDESKVYQCVLNILTNAVKYTEIGKINFSVNFNRESNNTIRILFKVMDTGIGIKDEDAKYLFKKFSRLDDAVSKEIEGSGLGLTIAKRYVDLMGGKIWFESQHLAGSTFYIELVQGIVDPTPIRSIKFNTEKPNYGAGLDCSNYKLLVVDDNELNVRVLSRLLERYKLKFDAVENGDKCIEAIKAETKYDLIFMDDSLPNISGTETMQILRKLMGDDLPPVVVITANAIVGMKDAYIAQGFSDYISKPIDMNELDRVINKFLKK